MRRPIPSALLALALAATSAAGCDSNSQEPTPTTPTPTTSTETFTGGLVRNGAFTHPFTVAAAGTVTATLNTVAPDSAIAIGMALGTWNGTLCDVKLANDNATQGIVVTGNASGSGSLCLRLYDIGKLTDPITYTVTVVHP